MRTSKELAERWPTFVTSMAGFHFCCLVGHRLDDLLQQPRSQLIAFLSAMEREPGLPTHPWERIVKFKAWVGGVSV